MYGELGTSREMRTGTCLWCQERLQRWHHVPVDPVRNEANRHADAYWCDDCGYGSLQPLPSESEIAELYRSEAYYTHVKSVHDSRPRGSLLDRVRTHLAYRLDRGQPLTAQHVHRGLRGKRSRICDLGCGKGELSAELAALGHRVVGVEIDPDARRITEEGDYTLLVGTAERLPEELPRGSFDAVVMRHVLEHCRDPVLALRNAGSLLKRGGLLFCEVPNNEALGLQYSGAAWAMFDLPRHLHFFSQRSLEQACRRAGLVVKESYFANYHRQFSNDWIEDERSLFERMTQDVERAPTPRLWANSRARAWRLFLSSLRRADAQRYDSVAVTAMREDEH